MAACYAADPSKTAPEPKLTSVHPFTVAAGRETEVVIRGSGLGAVRGLLFSGKGISGKILQTGENELRAAVSVTGDPGEQSQTLRAVAPRGVSNEIRIRTTALPALAETETPAAFPVMINGALTKRGEVDTIWYEARAGETISLEAHAGIASFDPALSIWAPAASWLDASRMERVAFQDEPLYFPGLDTTARLVHRFEKSGRHGLRISAFQGQGSPDHVYSLRITRRQAGEPDLHPVDRPEWPERWFTRKIGKEWFDGLAARGSEKPLRPIETYRAALEGSAEIPVIEETGLIEGRLGRAGEAHEIRLKIAEPRDLAIEIETPEATMPRFNPVVRIMQPDGHEVVTNVYTKLNNNGLYMMKMIQAKTTVTLRSVGEYRIQIRDITSDCWAKDFAYRVLIRPQVPHIGEVNVAEDRLNLSPGQSKALTINADREEGFKGFLSISVEGLPSGVTATTGLENPVEKPPLPNAGRRERYYPVPQTATVMLNADAGAAPTGTPVWVRVVVRPVVNGKPGAAALSKAIPLMVTVPD